MTFTRHADCTIKSSTAFYEPNIKLPSYTGMLGGLFASIRNVVREVSGNAGLGARKDFQLFQSIDQGR